MFPLEVGTSSPINYIAIVATRHTLLEIANETIQVPFSEH